MMPREIWVVGVALTAALTLACGWVLYRMIREAWKDADDRAWVDERIAREHAKRRAVADEYIAKVNAEAEARRRS